MNNPTILDLRDKLDTDHWSAKLVAEVVCSTYWGRTGVSLRELDRLDDENFQLAMDVMAYRRTQHWNDSKFYALACWCRVRHELEEAK